MYLLTGELWRDGFLDYHRGIGEYRIDVRFYATLIPIQGLYFVPAKDWRVLWNYINEVGVNQVFRKIRSRRHERIRNEKFLAFGIGYICERDAEAPLDIGQLVLFVAPCHPRCVERLVLPALLLKPTTSSAVAHFSKLGDGCIGHLDASHLSELVNECRELAGWSPFSGHSLAGDGVEVIFDGINRVIEKIDLSPMKKLPLRQSLVHERSNMPENEVTGQFLRAVIFGYGHYAKTNIIPNIAHRICVSKVHEIDPCQLGPQDHLLFACDTSPTPRSDERYDVYCIAGFHHTHAPLASYALRHGSSVMIEKPLATNMEQLDDLVAAMKKGSGKLFACFQKRYSILNEYARQDLGLHNGEPVNYHCIVYEVKLPGLHWYLWPNSRTRVISNGCHWIDHFLYLNHFAPIKFFDAFAMNNGDIVCTAELENGASFSMSLTDHGSPRIGVQEYIELRSDDVTVCIKNFSSYVSENAHKILRKAKLNKTSVYAQMYRIISEKIANNEPGDTFTSVQYSGSLALGLEQILLSKNRLLRPIKCDNRIRAPM